LHELATNAAKYGALSTSGGSVAIDWSVDGPDVAEPQFHLNWTERGGPPVTPPARRGFGSRLIERVVAADFRGAVGIDYEPAGVVCRLEAPLDGFLSPAPGVEP
jgi:two-component sensor histidine kinase